MENKDKVTIDGVEYKLGNISILDSGEAYIIDNTPYLAKDCKYDSARNVYVHINNPEVIKGIIGYKDGNFIMGHFSQSLDNVDVKLKENGKRLSAINKEALTGASFLITSSNVYLHLSKLSIDDFYKPAKITKEFKTSFDYGVSRVLEGYQSYYKNTEIKISSYAKKVARLIGDFTFGVEFETSAGLLSKQECYQNGLIPLRDGSIDGLEYVTIPLSGEKGVQALFNSILLLKDKSEVDKCCAVHYHIGNIPRTKEFIVALWIVITLIQSDIYSYQSSYKQDNRKFKSKDYAKALPNLLGDFDKILKNKSLDEAYDVIIEYLAMEMFGKGKQPELKDIQNHPADPNGTQKWHIKTRYAIVNLIPLIFGNKKTVEFRYHDVSLNPDLIVNELMINSCIVRYVINNQKEILENLISKKQITLSKIIQSTLQDGAVMDYVFDGLSYKRDIVCQSFLRGEHFIDYKNYNFKSASTISSTNPITPKDFALDFYKQNLYNVRGIQERLNDITIRRAGTNWAQIRTETVNRITLNNESIDNFLRDIQTTAGATRVTGTTNIANRISSAERFAEISRRSQNLNLETSYTNKINSLFSKAIGFSKFSAEDTHESSVVTLGNDIAPEVWAEKRKNKYFRNHNTFPDINIPIFTNLEENVVIPHIIDFAQKLNNDRIWQDFIISIDNVKLSNAHTIYREKLNTILLNLFSTRVLTQSVVLSRLIDIQNVLFTMMSFNQNFYNLFLEVLDNSMFIVKHNENIVKVDSLKLTSLGGFQFDESVISRYVSLRMRINKVSNTGQVLSNYIVNNVDINLSGYLNRVILETMKSSYHGNMISYYNVLFGHSFTNVNGEATNNNRLLFDEEGRPSKVMPAITGINNLQKATISDSLGNLFRNILTNYSNDTFQPTSLNLIFN